MAAVTSRAPSHIRSRRNARRPEGNNARDRHLRYLPSLHGATRLADPPVGDPLPLPVSSDEGGLGQLARARLLSGRMAPEVDRHPDRQPARNWRYWTVWPPCVLALTLSVYAIVVDLISMPPNGDAPTQGYLGPLSFVKDAGLIVVGVAANVVLYAAADRQASRRACALAGWVIAVLAYGWAVVMTFLSVLPSV